MTFPYCDNLRTPDLSHAASWRSTKDSVVLTNAAGHLTGESSVSWTTGLWTGVRPRAGCRVHLLTDHARRSTSEGNRRTLLALPECRAQQGREMMLKPLKTREDSFRVCPSFAAMCGNRCRRVSRSCPPSRDVACPADRPSADSVASPATAGVPTINGRASWE